MKNSKILFFTDIHGSLFAMKKIKSIVDEIRPAKVVFLGDLLYHGPRNPLPEEYDPLGVVELIENLGVPTAWVKGNCDAEVDETVIGRKAVSRYTVYSKGKKVICTHGDKLDKLDKKGAFAVVYGHFHVNAHTVSDGVNMVNISSVSLPKNGAKKAYGELSDGVLKVLDLDGNLLFEIE